jgi:dienelactone hydrolase
VAVTSTIEIPMPDGSPLPAALAEPATAEPASPGPGPSVPPARAGAAVVVLHELLGLNDDIRRISGRFAEHGYVALAPDFLAGLGPRPFCMARFLWSLTRPGRGRPYRQLDAARLWLAGREDVDADRIAVAGFCVGGGCGLAMACDFRVADRTASFGIPAARLGIVYGPLDCRNLIHLVGLARAKEILFTARRFDAAEAHRIGLLARLVPHDELRAAAVEAAHQVLQTAPDARVHVKRMLNERYGPIDYQTMFWALGHSSEPREGMQAFMEKRPPNWVPASDQ